jgi:hypothetical protein
MNASGRFDVELQPLDTYAKGVDGVTIGRMSIEKTFGGGLSASSRGEMLSAIPSVEGSAGYVAIEQVSGRLGDKRGSFVLQHYGTMQQGDNFLLLEVVPGSGAGELVGISGKMSIRVEDGEHYYEFEYQLAE